MNHSRILNSNTMQIISDLTEQRLNTAQLHMSEVKRFVQYSKTCLNRPIQKQIGLKTIYRLMLAKSIAECSKGSILQYVRPALC